MDLPPLTILLMASFFLANPKNWWVISDLVRKEIGPLLPFNDLFLIPSSAAPPVENNLLTPGGTRPPILVRHPGNQTLYVHDPDPDRGRRLPLAGTYPGRSPSSRRPCLQAFPFLTKVLQLLLEKAFLLSVQKKDPLTGLLNRDYFFRLVREKLTGVLPGREICSPTTFI